MGAIAKKYCRKIFVTDDNPRNENPKKIRKAIISSCKKLAVDIGSRRKAIEAAIKELREGELLLVAGKGHEETQDYGKKIINFSDKNVIKEIVGKRKFYFAKSNWSQNLAEKTFKNKNLRKINYNGVSINTRTIKKNNLFFAVRGKNTDGHKFIKEAFKKGAVKSVVSKNVSQVSNKRLIKVKNTLSSLNRLAKVTRENSCARIVGITGSVGKTTLKDLVNFALKNYGTVYCSPRSYNNKFGVPLSLSNLKRNTKYGVFEIGMNKRGEIDNLSKIIQPETAIIINISEAHLENFNSINDIAKAKSEIIGNILDIELIDQLNGEYEIDTIYHLAALLSTRAEFAPQSAHDVNVGGTMNLLNLALEQGRSQGKQIKFFFPSSIAVYGLKNLEEKELSGTIKENSYRNPSTMYGCNKLYCEHLGSYYSNHYQRLGAEKYQSYIDFRSIRFPGIISSKTIPTAGTSDYMSEMLHAAAQGKPYSCFVREDTQIPFMTMPDAIGAIIQIMNVPRRNLNQPVYNIRSFSPTAEEFHQKLLKFFPDAEIEYEVNEKRQKMVDSWPMDTDDSAAKKEWNWHSEHNLNNGLKEYLIPELQEMYK